jgi:hypothetical protein
MVDRTAAGLFLAVVVLLAPAPAGALAAGPERRGWDAYPLPTREEPAPPAASDSGTAQTPPKEMATTTSDDFERLALASFLALIAGGLTAWLVSLRWPHMRVAAIRTPAARPAAAALRPTTPELWLHAVAPPAVEPEPAEVSSSAPRAPPDPERAWAAEIGWHVVDGGTQFRVATRPVEGDVEPVTLGASPALEWPPSGAESVQALTDAVKTLESTLVAAGWSPLPRGSAWYAKRFTWQPGARTRPATPARTRHRALYETEFVRQVVRTERLRRTIGARLLEQQVAAVTRE